MSILYLTADMIGMNSGGGKVTARELDFFNKFHSSELYTRFLHRETLQGKSQESDPWNWDDATSKQIGEWIDSGEKFKHCHIYAGTFSRSVELLKLYGCKVTYTAAAHDIQASKEAYEDLGIPFNYPHLVVPELWDRYKKGYMLADGLIVPSTYSKSVMEGYGYKGKIAVIPHGVEIPDEERTREPKVFTVGYLGAIGPDKGLKYLLQAWKKLNYTDAVLKIAGKESTNLFVQHMVATYGGGNIQLVGWVDSIKDFYESLSLYVQPSVTEGFGCEVTEAMAHGVPVLCSKGAGASDLVPESSRFSAKDVDSLAKKIHSQQYGFHYAKQTCREQAKEFAISARNYTWEKIGKRYIDFWKEIVG